MRDSVFDPSSFLPCTEFENALAEEIAAETPPVLEVTCELRVVSAPVCLQLAIVLFYIIAVLSFTLIESPQWFTSFVTSLFVPYTSPMNSWLPCSAAYPSGFSCQFYRV